MIISDNNTIYNDGVKLMDTSMNIGSIPALPELTGGTFSYISNYLAPNGKLYFIPYQMNKVLILDPTDFSRTYINTNTGGLSEFFGGCLAPNGKIYCPSYSTTNRVLVIDTNNDTVSFMTSPQSAGIGSDGPQGGILAQNGMLYFLRIGTGAPAMLRINPTNDTVIMYNFSMTPSQTYSRNGILMPNGKIYYLNYTTSELLVFDPMNDTLGNVKITITPSITCYDWVAMGSIDNYLYIFPAKSSATTIVRINISDGTSEIVPGYVGSNITDKMFAVLNLPDRLVTLPYSEKKVGVIYKNGTYTEDTSQNLNNTLWYHNPSLCPNGLAFGIILKDYPLSYYNTFLKLKYSDWHIPNDLSTLPTSIYNKLYGKIY